MEKSKRIIVLIASIILVIFNLFNIFFKICLSKKSSSIIRTETKENDSFLYDLGSSFEMSIRIVL